MRKYTQILKMNLQIALAYRWNLILSSLMDIFRVVAEIAFWKIVFDTQSGMTISGYNFSLIITYYVFMFIIGSLMNVSNTGIKIANDIKNGTLNNLIIKPVSYLGYYFSETLSQKFVQFLFATLTFIPIFIMQASTIILKINLKQLLAFPLILLLSFLLNFFINIIISLLVFWITEVTAFFFLKDILLDFLSGRVFPIDLLPKYALNIFAGLPFMYCTFFPITVLTKGITDDAFIKGFIMQIIWTALLYIMIRILWILGIRRYSGTAV